MKRTILLTAMLMGMVSIAVANNQDDRYGATIPTPNGNLRIIPLADNAVRVKLCQKDAPELDELIYTEKAKDPKHKIDGSNPAFFTLQLKGMRVVYNKWTDQLTFYNGKGQKILEEVAYTGRELTASQLVDGQQRWVKASQSFVSPADEFIYGTGQFQDGYLNIRGLTRRLTQVNTQIAVPFILSSKGYGLLWNNYGLTDFNPSENSVKLQGTDEQGNVIEVNTTSTTGNMRERRVSDSFKAAITINEDGDYAFLLDVGQTMARKLYLAIDDKPVIDLNNMWLPPTGSAKAYLKKGQHTLTVKGVRGDSPTVSWRKDNNETTFSSPVATGIDYTVFAGNADQVVKAYRQLTGKAPLMPDYMLGYVHCRERYDTQKDLMENAHKFRDKNIPIDVIVQDWQWWGKYGWNAMQWDEGKYPDAAAMIRELHQMNIRFMLSVWSKVDKNSELGKELMRRGAYIEGTDWIDFFKPAVTEYYWQQFSQRLLKPYDIDIWWFDATEPENDDIHGRRVGDRQLPGDIYRNVYPLKVINTMHNGLLRDDAGRTPCILTRSAFSGMQRYNALVWSGDVGNDMDCLRRQIAGGLNYVATGMPWWTYDAGGFFRPGNQYSDRAYQLRMMRWIETSVFLPVMRVHGYQSRTEPWEYPADIEKMFVDCIKERQALLPYIKECARRVATEDYTLMRPLVFDFSDDPEALRQETEYMFGPKFLVCPITAENVSEWKVYLPKNKKGWTHRYTRQQYKGGQYVTVAVTDDHIPVFERN